MYSKKAKIEKKIACNCDNSLKIKCIYQFLVRLKDIKFKKNIFYYLCFYIKPLTIFTSSQIFHIFIACNIVIYFNSLLNLFFHL